MIFCLGFSSQAALAYTPNDPYLAKQTYLQRINAFGAWDYLMSSSTAKKEIIVAVLDSGVDIDHPDLMNQIWVNAKEIPNNSLDDDNNSYIDDINGWDFVESIPDPRPKFETDYVYDAVQHGTLVAGMIGAEFNNSIGIAGLAPKVNIMPLRVLDSQGIGSTNVLAQAIDYAVANGAEVINLSLVGKVADPQLQTSIDAAYAKGVAIVAASGNEESIGVNLDYDPRYPICDLELLNRVFGVAALDSSNKLANFSNYGSSCIDISAPGTEIFSTIYYYPEISEYASYYSGGWAGTSVAAPMVSATIANIKSLAPNLSLERIYQILKSSASSLQAAEPRNFPWLGAGILNMSQAVATAEDLVSHGANYLALAPLSDRPLVSVRNQDGSEFSSFLAYSASFTGGVALASADLNNDKVSEIVTAPNSNGGPHIRIFDLLGNVRSQFMAYDAKFRGGISLAIGDVDGDGEKEIITAPSTAAGPEIRVWTAKGVLESKFMAYDAKFRGGVTLTVGDTNGDGIDEIITAPNISGGPHIRIFNAAGSVISQFMAWDKNLRSGYRLAFGDFDHNGKGEIAITATKSARGEIVFFSPQGEKINSWLAFPHLGEVTYRFSLNAYDATGDLLTDLVVVPEVARPAGLKIFDADGQLLNTILTSLSNRYGWSVASIYQH